MILHLLSWWPVAGEESDDIAALCEESNDEITMRGREPEAVGGGVAELTELAAEEGRTGLVDLEAEGREAGGGMSSPLVAPARALEGDTEPEEEGGLRILPDNLIPSMRLL